MIAKVEIDHGSRVVETDSMLLIKLNAVKALSKGHTVVINGDAIKNLPALTIKLAELKKLVIKVQDIIVGELKDKEDTDNAEE